MEVLIEGGVQGLAVHPGLQLALAIRQEVDLDVGVRAATEVLGREVEGLQDAHDQGLALVVVAQAEVDFPAALGGLGLGIVPVHRLLLVEFRLDSANAGGLLCRRGQLVAVVHAGDVHLPWQVALERRVPGGGREGAGTAWSELQGEERAGHTSWPPWLILPFAGPFSSCSRTLSPLAHTLFVGGCQHYKSTERSWNGAWYSLSSVHGSLCCHFSPLLAGFLSW